MEQQYFGKEIYQNTDLLTDIKDWSYEKFLTLKTTLRNSSKHYCSNGTDEILGRYNSLQWIKSGGWRSCKDNFIFSLKNGTIQSSILNRIKADYSSEAIYCLGGDHDIWIDHHSYKKMQKYQFDRLNINNRNIKVNPIEKQTCKYFYVQGKIDFPYILNDNSDNLKCMFVYVLAIKFKNDKLLLSEFATKLFKLCQIDYQKCFDAMSNLSVLEKYAIDLAYYCSIDTLRLQELLIIRNIVGDYMQLAKISSIIVIVPYEGALVLEKKNSNKPVGVLDFGSMYSNAIIEKNISTDTCININFTNSNLNIVIDNGKIYSKFISQENRIGLMPLMCKELLQLRFLKFKSNQILDQFEFDQIKLILI
ncbi:hypothetical protein C2G38_2227554 [Gigaspora rosea]|uniref:DNA-directed DNA polymerase n=1 Tax=Gigaspora rosea TaxID=44941 RepID=A0A397TYT3_9GLOM|nr:hypothetical protein C2G38_2227554 [Gigaspora rosea]